MGGIGNQLFQYAFGRALSNKTNAILYIDKTWFEKDHGDIYSKRHLFKLDNYSCNYRKTNKFIRFIFRKIKSIEEQVFKYDSAYFKIIGVINKFHGYWQSYHYFDFMGEQIRKEIQIRNKSNEFIAAEHEIQKNNYICIHVRRGDYIENKKVSNLHGVLDLQYYLNSINFLESKFGEGRRLNKLIFSDDPEWCAENLKIDSSFKIFDKENNLNDYEEIILMSKCKYFVIANSSFSWWSAYLSGAEGDHIVAPMTWFKDSNIEPKDIIPIDWVRIRNSFI